MLFKRDEIQQLNSLQRQRKQLDQQLTLEQSQTQLIKDYVMKQGTYKVIITVYEVNDLQPKSLKLWKIQLDQKTAADSFVEILVNGQTKRTEIRQGTNNPIFDEQFFCEFPQMSIEELDRAKIMFNVYDTKLWGHTQALVGSFQLDWTNVYFKKNHEIYRAWLTLYDPNNELDGPVGYLLANIAVLGPNDQITVHDSAFIKDPLVTIEDTITSPKLPLIDYSIAIQIYRAQNLIPLDFVSSQVRAYVIAKFSGNKVKTSNIKSLNPEWNQCIKIGTQVPNKSKYITLQVRNKNIFSQDDIIGVLKVPFVDILQDQDPKPKWGHLYGPPIAGKDVQPTCYATKMQVYGDSIGSHYRGRLLYKVIGKKDVFTKNIKNKLIFKFPYRVIPVVPSKLYMLRVDLIEGFGLPEQQFCYMQVCMGQYTVKSKKFSMKDGFCQFFDMLEEKKMNLPQNLESLPDLVIYFCNGLNEENRVGFLRLKASQVFNSDPLYDQVKVHELKFDKSINHKQVKSSCGFVACRLHLFTSSTSNPPRKKITDRMKIRDEFQLRVVLYRGEGFPPANEQGDCDPMVKFSFNELKFESKAIMETYNPIWNQVISSKVKIQNLFSTNMEKCLICDVYDFEESQKHNYIGSFNVRMNGSMRKKLKLSKQYNNETIDFIYSKPKWCYVVNPNIQIGNPVFGRVLISCSIFKKKYEINGRTVKFSQIEMDCRFNQIRTEYFTKSINLYMIGIRDLKVNRQQSIMNKIKRTAERTLRQVHVKPKIRMSALNEQSESYNIKNTGNNSHEDQSQKDHKEVDLETNDTDTKQNFMNLFQLKNCGCQINKVYKFRDVQIPKNKFLSTFAEFKITDEGGKYVYGSNSVNLKNFRNIFEQELSGDSPTDNKEKLPNEDDILDVQQLQIRLKKLQVLNKINEQMNLQSEAAKYISKTRIEQTRAKNLIPPQQLDHKNLQNASKNVSNNLQEEIEMEKLIREFEYELQKAKQEGDNEYAYIKYNQGSSSNNNRNGNNGDVYFNKNYNSIDVQNNLLNMKNNNKEIVNNNSNLEPIDLEEQNQDMSFINENESGERNGYMKKSNNKKQLSIEAFSQEEDERQPQSSAKHLIREKPQKGQATLGYKMPKKVGKTSLQHIKDTQPKGPNIIPFQDINHAAKHTILKVTQEAKDIVSNFDLNESLALSEHQYPQKAIKYGQVEKGLQFEEEHRKQALQKQEQYKYANAVKLSLFKWMRKEKTNKEKQTYEDYDTDEDENLDIIPEWYKGRLILGNDLEQYLESNRKIENIPIYRGRKIQGLDTRVKQKVGTIKMVVLSENSKKQLQDKAKYYEGLLRQKQYSCRIYVLKGKSLLTRNLQKPNTYLRFTYGQKTTIYKDKLVKNDINPEYYLCHQEWIKLPGPSTIKIEVMQALYLVGQVGDHLVKDKMIGYTEIDVEDRYFMKKWHLLERKPIQLRNLYSQYGIGTQGRLQTWVDLVQKKKWLVDPVIKITPPPWDEYELRVVVWSTKDCVFKNQELQSNDIFVRGQIGKSNYQQTDVHWACRSVGNFNYRLKFPIFYPPKPEDMYSDIFIVQLWDKDVVGFDNLIGQTRINLNKMHKLIQKAVKRKKPVTAVKKIIEKNMRSTDKFWFDVFNHREKDEFGQLQSQGRVQLSFELVPMQTAKTERANGYGRSEPNVYPTLAQPSGRLNFNLLHPLDFMKQLLGPNLYKSLCIKFFLILLIALIVLLFVFFGTSIVAGLVARK